MAHAFCYAQCRNQPMLNHTDGKALDERGMCGFGIGVVFRSTHLIGDIDDILTLDEWAESVYEKFPDANIEL